ncbi:hypothetical protein [uncultured Lutibacter sp.]|uniref:hypothetical protein n=1 Tax=uncultured Lutibacter sp. TaxID=437739 RepID=UPI002627FE8D|nr:hypothetical protein [uncultured Lutibacter sp.]
MNKTRILGIIILLIGLFLMFKIENLENGWLINAFIGAIVGSGFVLTVFGGFNFNTKF